jgi:predicted RNA-binding Zn ribbon-like protein
VSEYPADHLSARAEWVREREAERAAPTDLRADVLLLAEAIQRLASVLEFVAGAQPGWVQDARRAAEEVIVRCRVGDRDADALSADNPRIRENRIAALLGRLAELAAEGYSMSAEEVRFQHGVLPR